MTSFNHKLSDITVGKVMSTNECGNVVVLEVKNWRNIRILFLEYPYETSTEAGKLFSGSIRNPMRPTIHNIGFFGAGPYRITKAYEKWLKMLNRVYNSKNESDIRSYNDVTVHPDWHCYQTFAAWYHRQIDHFDEVDFTWELDKDLLVPGNRIYGPETCCIIPEQINLILCDGAFGRGSLPLGVTKTKRGKPYKVRVNSFGEQIYLGRYETICEAQKAYWKKKFEIIQHAAIIYWKYLPYDLAFRLVGFGQKEAYEYYGDDALIWSC